MSDEAVYPFGHKPIGVDEELVEKGRTGKV